MDTHSATRWEKEAAFFDAIAKNTTGSGLIDPLALARYSRQRLRRRFNKEYRFRILGDIRGKSILDVGCGYGGNVILLAKFGANVTGIDISPKSIEVAHDRARANDVSQAVEFVCAPMETAAIPENHFDIIWGDGILHHLIADLDHVMACLVRFAKPGALLVFSEPVSFSRAFRRLRSMAPVHTDATPDERPLEKLEIEIMRRYLPDLHIRLFDLLGRLNRFILCRQNYERSPFPRRTLANLLAAVDWCALSTPGLKCLAGQAVLWGYAQK